MSRLSNESDSTYVMCSSNNNSPTFSEWSQSTIVPRNNSQNLEGEDSFNARVSEDFDFRFEGESLDNIVPLEEEELNHQESDDVDINQEEADSEEMLSRVLSFTESCNSQVEKQIEEVKTQTAMVENITKDVIQERDQALMDLRNVEQAFSDVYRKYERAKLMLENSKASEDILKQRNEDLQYYLISRDEQNEALKHDRKQIAEKSFKDSQARLAAVEAENSKLLALYRRGEMRVETLETELKCKQQENAQLSKLTDELIGRSASGAL